MRMLFARSGLQADTFDIAEVDWPAPGRFDVRLLKDVRAMTLFALRRMSQAVTRLSGGRWGNRYFFVGQRPAN